MSANQVKSLNYLTLFITFTVLSTLWYFHSLTEYLPINQTNVLPFNYQHSTTVRANNLTF